MSLRGADLDGAWIRREQAFVLGEIRLNARRFLDETVLTREHGFERGIGELQTQRAQRAQRRAFETPSVRRDFTVDRRELDRKSVV